VACVLAQAGVPVVVLDLPVPTALRLTVAFAAAVLQGEIVVGGVLGRHVTSGIGLLAALHHDVVPLWTGSEADLRAHIHCAALVEARMRGLSGLPLDRAEAPLVVALGPGYEAGLHAHVVIETNRGPNLGGLLWRGQAQEHTGVPGLVLGLTQERILRAPASGVLRRNMDIGALVDAGAAIAHVDGLAVRAPIAGMVRGLKLDGVAVRAGWKVGDVDPRRDRALLTQPSDKAEAVGAGVLEALREGLGPNLPEAGPRRGGT
jgi:xanthine dehydrogenase accessory factor